MDNFTPPSIGTMVSIENTSDNADEVRDYYSAVLGWNVHPISMGEYDDYVMLAQDDSWVAGICHRRGPNADLSGGWIPCVRVVNVESAIAEAIRLGGKQIGTTRETSPGSHYAVIEDMNGAMVSVIDFPGDNGKE